MKKIFDLIRKLRCSVIRSIVSCKPSLPLPDAAVIIAPHPDDEVFGCCGLMQQMIAGGKGVELVIMTGGGKSHSGCCDIDEEILISKRRQLTRNAALIYGLREEQVHFLNYPDGAVMFSHAQTEVLKRLLSAKNNRNIAVFYPHLMGEGWSDHYHTSKIAQKLCASICPDAMRYEYCVWFWFYNSWKIDWKQAFTLKLSKQEHDKKMKSIDAYIAPKSPCGKPWSGVLPSVFLWTNKWKRELYFRVK